MNWAELIGQEIEQTYKTAEGLMDLVDEDQLGWKPATGSNWMTTGQLLRHMTSACGSSCRGFVTGDWGMPEGVDMNDLSLEEMLPAAEELLSVDSVAAAKELLAEDRQVALDMLASCGEDDFAKPAPAPWDPSEISLGHRLLQMVEHLKQHKGQLFYYLKLQDKPVHSGLLWGM